jgi:glycosyltransferase involved in cell wall biosynthesis
MSPTPQLRVSVIIPMRNESGYIRSCLESLLKTESEASDYEVIVVDGGSTDGSRAIVLEMAPRFQSLRVIDNPSRHVAAGVNLGIQLARGRYIVRLDAHSEYPPHYIRDGIEELERTGAADVGGPILTTAPDTYMGKAIALTVQHPFGVGNSRFRLGGGGFVDTVPFGIFRRELFDELGMFREDLRTHEDFEFCARIRRAGGKIYQSEKLAVVYHHSPTIYGYLSRAWRYGVWVAVSWRVAPYCFALRHAVAMYFVLALLATSMLAALQLTAWIPLLLILGAYVAVAFAASLHICWTSGWRYLPVLGVLFFLRHFVYGLGSVVGLLYWPRATTHQPAAAAQLGED